MDSKRLPPGPKPRPFLGNLPDMAKDRLGFYLRAAREYGDVVHVRLPQLGHIYYLFNPEHVEYVLVTNNRNFKKHKVWEYFKSVFGNGLLSSEGEFWLRQRRLMQPAFHKDRIAAYGKVMVDYSERLLEGWQDGQVLDIHHEMMRLTLQIVVKTLFDADVTAHSDTVGKAIGDLMGLFMGRVMKPLRIPENIPTPGNRRLKQAIRHLDEIVYGMIQERRANFHDRGDLLSMLLLAQDEDGSRMTDKQLRDEVLTLFLAGHETTALVMTWTFYLLAQHPEVEQKLLAELNAVLGERPPTISDIPALRYIDMVIKESMRLYPPAYVIGRAALNDCEIGGYHVPAGTNLIMSPWVTHRDSRFYPDPDAFKPERWQEDFIKRLPKYAYFPFSGGPRICIGNTFAMMEAVLLLATLGQKYHLELLPGQKIELYPAITLRPKGEVRMRLHKRPPGDSEQPEKEENTLKTG